MLDLLQTVIWLNYGSNWVSDSDWACIGSLTEKYLQSKYRVLFLDEENIQFHPVLIKEKPVYIITNPEKGFIDFGIEDVIDTVIIRDFVNETELNRRGYKNKVIFVTSSDQLNMSKILWERCRALDVVTMSTNEYESNFFSWSPYVNCTKIGEVDLSYQDSCKNGKFKLGVDLYPNKVPENLNKCPLYIAYGYQSSYDTPSISLLNFYNFEGPHNKLIHLIVKKLNATLHAATTDFDDFFQKAGKLDILTFIEYGITCILFQGEFVLAVPTPNQDLFSSLYSGFSSLIWSLILLALCTMLLFVSLTDFLSEKGIQSYKLSDVIRATLGNSVVGRPRYFKTFNAIVIIFELYSLHIIWFYQITSLSNLFYGSYERPIETVQDAADKKLTMYVNEWTTYVGSRYFNRDRIKAWNEIFHNGRLDYLLQYENTSEILKEVSESKTAMLFDLKQDIINQFRKVYPNVALTTKFLIMKPEIALEQYTFCMTPSSHPLLPIVSRYVSYIVQAGLYDHWAQSVSHIEKYEQLNVQRPLNMAHVQPVFYVVLIFLSLSILLFIAETVYKTLKLKTTRFISV